MATSPKSVRYYVQVARLRLDTAIVEVDASDDGDAEQKAIEQARLLPGAEWELQPFDHAAYQPHAEAMVAQDELRTGAKISESVRLHRGRGVVTQMCWIPGGDFAWYARAYDRRASDSAALGSGQLPAR